MRQRKVSSKHPKIRLNDEECEDPREAIDKALEGLDESVDRHREANEELSEHMKSSPPPSLTPEAAGST